MHTFGAALKLPLLVCAIFCTSVTGGELSDFEEDVAKGEELHSPKGGMNDNDRLSNSVEHDNDCDSFGECILYVFIDIFSGVFVALEQESMAWVRGDGE